LTEASVDCESGMMNYVVVGIGINTSPPAGDFPEELRDIAGAVFPRGVIPELRCRMAAAVLDKLMEVYKERDPADVFEAYKSRSLILGRPIWIHMPGKDPVSATAEELAPDYALLVRYADGSTGRVNSGEVSVRVPQE
ncbi:MAG: biotin--[Clostridia bacterium]|nr:biotin--[acetyl-CoA-carboxylase] ligase [Clostridia bacterium]